MLELGNTIEKEGGLMRNTLSKSRGCVQAAAAAEASPPRYHRWATGLSACVPALLSLFCSTLVAGTMLGMLLYLYTSHYNENPADRLSIFIR